MPGDDPRPAVFLDRDGTLNVEVDRVATPEALVPIPDAARAVHRLNALGVPVILVTNQAIVGRGYCDEAGLRRIHDRLEALLATEDAKLDAIYHCPHAPEAQCDCRKPKPGLVLRAQREMNIDLAKSWMIGDSVKDIRLARATGMRVILVRTGKAGSDAADSDYPDYVCDSLSDAVSLLASEFRRSS